MLNQQEEAYYSHQTSLDARLAAQVQAICTYSLHSPERQQLLNQFVNEILHSGKLGHPQRAAYPTAQYEDLYNEALQKTLIEICQKIDHYNPAHPVMAWVNFRLGHQFRAVVKDEQQQGMTQLPKVGHYFPVRLPALEDLPLSAPVEADAEAQIQQFLRQDPEGRLQKLRLRERPEVTFQRLALAKFVEGKSWAEVGEHLGISAPTLCSFFNRHLRDLIPYFKKYLDV